MTDTTRVQRRLDVFGDWSPTLAFVSGARVELPFCPLCGSEWGLLPDRRAAGQVGGGGVRDRYGTAPLIPPLFGLAANLGRGCLRPCGCGHRSGDLQPARSGSPAQPSGPSDRRCRTLRWHTVRSSAAHTSNDDCAECRPATRADRVIGRPGVGLLCIGHPQLGCLGAGSGGNTIGGRDPDLYRCCRIPAGRIAPNIGTAVTVLSPA